MPLLKDTGKMRHSAIKNRENWHHPANPGKNWDKPVTNCMIVFYRYAPPKNGLFWGIEGLKRRKNCAKPVTKPFRLSQVCPNSFRAGNGTGTVAQAVHCISAQFWVDSNTAFGNSTNSSIASNYLAPNY